ncbi:hypothetical protein C84B14_15501 [Salinisphaera sp. C84B14]
MRAAVGVVTDWSAVCILAGKRQRQMHAATAAAHCLFEARRRGIAVRCATRAKQLPDHKPAEAK